MQDKAKIDIRRVTSRKEIEQAIALRLETFVGEFHFPEGVEIDEYDTDPTTFHFLAFDEGEDDGQQRQVVGVARCVVDATTHTAKIGRVVVLPHLRGQGLGRRLMDFVEDTVRNETNVERFALHALLDRLAFYERCGYKWIDGEVFLEQGLQMIYMEKRA